VTIPVVLNLYEDITGNPDLFKQFNCGETLITQYDCPLDKKLQDLWSRHNYIIYVTDGRKIWHTAQGSFDLRKGSCMLVRKGACIVEQLFESVFCNLVFFLPDEFICEVLKTKSVPISWVTKKFDPVIPIDKNDTLEAFFYSIRSYFGSRKQPDPSLLEIKFRELVLTVADNPKNTEALSYFNSLMNEPQAVSIKKIMDDNFCFNLKLEEYARLTNRSLSAFKRDFQKLFNTTPGKWLLEKRLHHAMNLLSNSGKSVSEAAFESGFENPSHFSRSFHQYFGVVPTAVRYRETS
jgi:AraC-like DNA-binding protein